MDGKEFDEQLLALGQHMKLQGERLYPEWQWELYPRDSQFSLWCLDSAGLKARLPNFDDEGQLLSKQGIVILLGEYFLTECVLLARDEQIATVEAVLHNAIKESKHIPPGMMYPTFTATTYGGERNSWNEHI